jgi:hypothetical protein
MFKFTVSKFSLLSVMVMAGLVLVANQPSDWLGPKFANQNDKFELIDLDQTRLNNETWQELELSLQEIDLAENIESNPNYPAKLLVKFPSNLGDVCGKKMISNEVLQLELCAKDSFLYYHLPSETLTQFGKDGAEYTLKFFDPILKRSQKIKTAHQLANFEPRKIDFSEDGRYLTYRFVSPEEKECLLGVVDIQENKPKFVTNDWSCNDDFFITNKQELLICETKRISLANLSSEIFVAEEIYSSSGAISCENLDGEVLNFQDQILKENEAMSWQLNLASGEISSN